MSGRNEDPGRGPKESYFGYKVYDQHYEEVGKVDEMYVDQNDRPTYLGVRMGLLGTKYTLIPMDIVRVNDHRELVEVAESKGAIEGAPQFDNADELTAAQETEVRSYYGLPGRGQRETTGDYPPEPGFEERPGVDLGYGERRGSTGEFVAEPSTERPAERPPEYAEHHTERREFTEESSSEQAVERPYETTGREASSREEATGSVSERDDELRIQRAEEELRAGTREREAGEVNVRKRVRTDQKQIRVPKKREEVVVERVSVEDEGTPASSAAGGEISPSESEEEIRVPVVEEEVVVEKRPVVKEEIRLRKRVVEEQAVVEEEVRKEEVEVDETDYRDQR